MLAHEKFRNELEGWTEQLLRPYIARVEAGEVRKTSKEFNDPVWSTIVLRPLEVTILDSPLLQRLRLIRQLGLVHLVYPAANHSRLEHSIGVVRQIDRLVESVNEHFANRTAAGAAGDDVGCAISEQLRHVLRLTALCHDVGHGAMSHVSENALEHFPEAQEIRDAFSDEIGSEEKPLSEVASYLIIGTPAFGDLLSAAAAATNDHLPPSAEEQMQRLVLGEKVNDRIPLLQEFMSGPFDADKLDYMTRDAMMSGVPIVTDTERLVQKIRAVRVPEGKLPDKVADTVAPQDEYVMTGISMSGARAIDELMLGRVLLHDKLYRHHKVRAAEAMVGSIFRLIAPVVEEGPAMAPLKLEDHQLLELQLQDLRGLAGRSLTSRERKRGRIAVLLAEMLRRRELFVRAFAFARDMPGDPYHAEPQHIDGLGDLVTNGEDLEFVEGVVERIAAELVKICELLQPQLVEKYDGEFTPFLALDPPKLAPLDTDAIHAYLITESGDNNRIYPARPGIAGASRWSDAYLLTRETGYVFSPEELAPFAYLASEVVLRRDHGVRVPSTMHPYTKQGTRDLEQKRRQLDSKRFFRSLPSDLAPLPEELETAAAGRRIDKVLDNLQGYEGPKHARSDKGLPLRSRERILDWLKQFGSEFGDEPLKLLEKLRVVGRDQVVTTLEEFLHEHRDVFDDPSVCPLGTAKDSSAITTYYARDLRAVRVLSVPDALAGEEPIVFIDDFIGSGQQAVSILEAWFGVEPSTDLHEDRGDPLSEVYREGLRSRPLGFVFASGMQGGVGVLEKALDRLELNGTVKLAENHLAPRAFNGPKSAEREKLEQRCREIGLQLLEDGVERHDLEWQEKRALGYGNEAFLLTFPYNTPTQSLTCLWKSGKVDGVDWTALLPRRPKL